MGVYGIFMKFAKLTLLLCIFMPGLSLAHPVTFKSGIEMQTSVSEDSFAASATYSLDHKNGIQVKYWDLDNHSQMDPEKRYVKGVQYNRLIQRWNMPEAQANIYGGVGIASAHANGTSSEPALTGLLRADYETRDFMLMYAAEGVHNTDFTHIKNEAGVGFAPYRANYDDLNTWLMLHAKYITEYSGEVGWGPMIRMFKDNLFWEVGLHTNGDAMVNFSIHY